MKETATTTSLGSIGQITEEHELIIDVQVEDSSPVKPDATQESKQARALKEERESEELEEDQDIGPDAAAERGRRCGGCGPGDWG